jgi:threonine dehydratase
MNGRPTWEAIRIAHDRIRPYIHRTPVLTCASIDAMVGAKLFFKCENFQKVGAFKIRGATNAVLSLSSKEAVRGVATHSSGNHAAALAQAARWRGIPAYIVMPEDSPKVKREAVLGYGGQVTSCRPTIADRETTARRLLAETGAAFIHPYDDERIVAGQATAAIELLEDVPDLEVVVAPVGGGGLLAGTILAAKAMRPDVRVVAAEPERVDDAYRSWKAGRIATNDATNTIADGLKTNLGELTFSIIHRGVDEVVLAPEESILPAVRVLLERMKLVAEPSAAVPLAAMLSGRLELTGRRVGVVVSGGNVDFESLRFDAPAAPPTPQHGRTAM